MNFRLAKAGINYWGSILKSKIKTIPIYVNLFYTRRCNLKCEFCSTIKRPAKKELTLAQWKECVDVLYSLGNRYLSITGGEPLVRNDLPEFINYLAKRSILHSLATNGLLLTENKLRQIAEAGLMHLGLSTQSLIPGRHSKSQKKEFFEMLIHYREKYGFEISALVTLTNENVKEVPEMVSYLGSKGINVAPNIVTSGKGDWWFRNYCPGLQFNQTGLKELRKTINYLIKSKNIFYSRDYLNGLYKYACGKRPFFCEAGSFYLSVNDDGYIMPCQDFPPTKIHYSGLKDKFPLVKPECDDCMWPCYYEETYKRNHFIRYISKSIKTILKV